MFGNYILSDECLNEDSQPICPIGAGEPESPEDYFHREHIMTIITMWVLFIIVSTITGCIFRTLSQRFLGDNIYEDFFVIEPIVYGIIIMLIAIYRYNANTLEVCNFPRWCHEGVNNTIIPSNYYYQMDTCPRVKAWLISWYEDTDPPYLDNDCSKSDYGCCTYESARCTEAIENGDHYSFYLILRGAWFSNILKEDKDGTNCPTIEEIILRVSNNSKNNYPLYFITVYLLQLFSLIIALSIILYSNQVCMKHERVSDQDTDSQAQKMDV